MKKAIYIVEDTKIDAQILQVILENYLDEKHIDYSINIYDTGLAFYADYEEGYINPSIVFMDIFLPKSNGLEICKKMRAKGYPGDIIITTDTKDHALEAFEVDARGYIMKPYNAQDIFRTLDRVCQYASIRTFTFKIRQQIFHVPVSDICYIESNSNKCTIHCHENVIYTVYKKLSDIEKELSDTRFIRCHKSYLVNMDCIAKVTDCFTMECGDTVPIRQTDLKNIRDSFLKYEEKYK